MAEVYGGVGDLIARLKKDGVDAGESERARILGDAQREAERIVVEAQKAAAKIVDGARTERERLQRQLETELRLAARDFIAGFHQRLSSQVIRPMVNETVSSALAEDTRVFFLLQEVLVAYVGGDGRAIDLVVDAKKRDALVASFTGELARRARDGSLRVIGEDGFSGFRLSKKGEGYVWDMSVDAITSEMARLIDPALRALFAPSKDATPEKK
jgi:vacuolar-type H+-ATPase subunit E/Vma4